jgi:beta-lactamase regulating signal transducer with metallopeptidase domain
MWWVGERLLTGSAQGAVVVVLVWLACRNSAAIPASVRAFLWWLVSLKLVLALVPLPELPVPLLPAGPAEAGHYVETTVASQAVEASVRPIEPARTVHLWLAVAIGLWLAGVAALTLHLLRVYVRLRIAVRSSTPFGPEDAGLVDRLARLLALRKTPDVRVSDRVTTPLVAGLFRPTVLIPARAFATLSPGELAMAICHELAHVRRRDLLLGWVPAVAERLFFFHPLARLAAREYVVAREAACDTLVLRVMDVAPREYGRMLVRLGVGRLDPAFMAAGSSPSISSLRRRLDMLQHLTFSGSRRRVIWLLVAVSALTCVPLRLVARTTPQPEVPAAAPVLAALEAEPGTSPSPAQESAKADDARRRAEAEYRKAVEAEYRRVLETERTENFLEKEYEAVVKEYKTAVLNFTGNQEVTEAERVVKALELQLQTQGKAPELQEFDEEELRRQVEQVLRTMKVATELRQKTEEARRADREELELRLEAEFARAQAGADTQTALARQLEALTIAQQKLSEQVKSLVAQQDQLLTVQRQLSNQVEVLRELERIIRMVARPPAAAAPSTAPAPPVK